MARARNIKPAFFMNDDLADCGMAARLLFIGLWTIADRDGKLEDKPKRIKAEIFPYDEVNVDASLEELAAANFIVRYQSEGMQLIWIPNFTKHQNPHKQERKSELPDCTGANSEQAPSKHDAESEPIVLIPDCGNLNPSTESKTPPSPPAEKRVGKNGELKVPEGWVLATAESAIQLWRKHSPRVRETTLNEAMRLFPTACSFESAVREFIARGWKGPKPPVAGERLPPPNRKPTRDVSSGEWERQKRVKAFRQANGRPPDDDAEIEAWAAQEATP